MAIYTKKEFAERCGIKANDISTYVKRHKIIMTGDGIDDTIDTNRAFLLKRQSKIQDDGDAKSLPVTTQEAGPSPEIDGESQSQSLTESERQLKYLATLKRKREIEKLEIDIAKKKGEVIPSDLVKPVFLQHNQSIVTEFKNAADEIVRVFAQKKSLSVNEKAEITGKLVECINISISKATKLSVKAVKNIISEFADKKGVGERNG